ncbi:hypothetical protein Fot_05568 [Forsythia ovata]|uniref:Uncharacterized protein n=1 Tax=Forsythia ovata TaxID=205694 RepID=A0ABD1WQ06_9LAMI
MVMVEGWVEYVRELSGRHEDLEAEPKDWACSEYPSDLNIFDFTKLKDQYRISESVRLIHPNKTDRPCSPADGEVSASFLTEKDLAVIGQLYSYRGDFYGVIGSDHLFVKHNLMKKQGSSTLPKIGLAAKKITPVVKKKSSDNEQKRVLVGLSLKGGEKNQDVPPNPVDPR